MPQHVRVLGERHRTFMILGDICTRACGFCAVKSGNRPNWIGPSRSGWPRPSKPWG